MKPCTSPLMEAPGASFAKQTKSSPAPASSTKKKPGKKRPAARQFSETDPLAQSAVWKNHSKSVRGIEVHVLCIYSTVNTGKLAREWIETAFQTTSSKTRAFIEYFNYAVLSDDGMNWAEVMRLVRPDIILLLGDGQTQLVAGLRHSLRELLTMYHNGSKPLVIFRNLEPEPTLNTRILLDFISALAKRSNFELKAVDGNGTPISCFHHPQHLLNSRPYPE